ncbi:nucleotide disphospho-sugar-binding domain-containing protein [Pseudomonas weihenstephanensis]|uniref:N-glycosyltransferase n=1 Tax=Pseudomonas weihenstephanensis TaxID=1608994 RepID=A0A0J6ITW2_9PSED|nr:nucleotide disphospho-sugar-binding domain-containing protein [Pseudomonas weihenstephanensis]KMN15589.1 N-glycosyltransferase [Pseudomonas weihenstephanensis]MBM1190292.1 glycosyltransferase [Pseudomonas weihenstephanensis]GLX87980.1 N-glycosyltransferase [Pseudomonas fragi]
MARLLIACTASPGHVLPLLKIAEHLIGQGHELGVLTGKLFRQQGEHIGAEFFEFNENIDFDYRHVDRLFPQRALLPPGPEQTALALRNFFADAMPLQDLQLRQLIQDFKPDALIIESVFYGALPLLLGPVASRPPVMCIGETPLGLSSRDSIFFGPRIPPAVLPTDCTRESLVISDHQRLIDEVHDYFNQTLIQHGHPTLRAALSDTLVNDVERFCQLSTQAFEYARDDLPQHLRFVGPLRNPPTSRNAVKDPFIEEDGRPLVIVTQGTVANADLNQLLLPTLRALAGLPVKVLALTGGRGTDPSLIPTADNLRVTDFVAYEQVLPHASVFITNGGYGSINSALGYGVPVLIAGTGEDKAETSTRVVWARCGINLNTSYPSEQAIAHAVQKIITQPSYRLRAKEIAEDFLQHDALAIISDELQQMLAETA